MKIMTYSDIQNEYICKGRLISPYIDRIQHKWASYVVRKGLPRIPIEELIKLGIDHIG